MSNAVMKRILAGVAVVAGILVAMGESKQLPEGMEWLQAAAALVLGICSALGITSTGVKGALAAPVDPPEVKP